MLHDGGFAKLYLQSTSAVQNQAPPIPLEDAITYATYRYLYLIVFILQLGLQEVLQNLDIECVDLSLQAIHYLPLIG